MDNPQDTQSEQNARMAMADKLFQTAVILIYGKRKSIEKAIKCIQRAITIKDSDYKYWQILGEAYYQRGSLSPAINCFMKSLKIVEDSEDELTEAEKSIRQSNCTYSRMRMSDIRLSVGHLDEALTGYKDIINIDPSNAAALIGLAKANLQMARNSFSSNLVKLGHSYCINALESSLRAIKLCPHLCLTWKLASDCCLILYVFGQRNEFSEVINVQFPGSDENGIVMTRLTCLELAQQFLSKALQIEPFQQSCCLWHNLGISLYLKAVRLNESQERLNILKRSIKCLLKALDNDRDNSQIKNSIGVVAFNLNLLNTAQNFFIRSIQSNMSTSEIQFSNLGYIYLQKGEFRLASTAFSRCQAEEPLYCRSWLGNALINEQNGLDNLSLLRHCYRLENNYESQLMFATKVVSLPHSEEHKKDIVNALDCMQRIINYDDSSPEANNTLGLLFEKSNCKSQAQSCFDKAYKLSPQDSRIIMNKLRLHLATNVCIDENHGPSINTDFITKAEKLSRGSNREYILNYVYYLFNNEDYRNINPLITRLIDKLQQDVPNHKVGAQIFMALVPVDGRTDFKSWLFKNIIDTENYTCIESLINLLCLMVLGSVTGDDDLVDQVSRDLLRQLIGYISSQRVPFTTLLNSFNGYWIKMIVLCSIFCLKDQNKLIRPLIALFPTVAELWLYLGLSLMISKAKHQTSTFCIKKASLIGSTQADLCVVCEILLAILSKVNKPNQISVNQLVNHLSRAVYKYPNKNLLWKTLLATKKSISPKKSTVLDGDNFDLFNLSLDHILETIVA